MTMSSEESLRIQLGICQWCPMCRQLIKDVRFKNHILSHWVRGGGIGVKGNEEYSDFVRRIFKSKVKIQFELLDE